MAETAETQSEVRSRKYTEKGLQYQLSLKGEQRDQVYKKLKNVTERIEEEMGQSDSDKDIHRLYSCWMSLFEQLELVFKDYNCLLSPDEQLNDEQDWWTPKLKKLQRFKMSVESWFTTLKRTQSTSGSVHVRKSGSTCGSVRSGRSSKASSIASNLSFASVLLKEQQRLAELQVRAQSLNKLQTLKREKLQLEKDEETKRKDLEKKMLDLKEKEEQMKLESEIAVASARCNVVQSLARSQGQSIGSDVFKIDFAQPPPLQDDYPVNDIVRPLQLQDDYPIVDTAQPQQQLNQDKGPVLQQK